MLPAAAEKSGNVSRAAELWDSKSAKGCLGLCGAYVKPPVTFVEPPVPSYLQQGAAHCQLQELVHRGRQRRAAAEDDAAPAAQRGLGLLLGRFDLRGGV